MRAKGTGRRRTAALAVLAGLTGAWATPAAAETAMVQELIVTGSRLPKADLTADSPIVTVSAERLRAGATLTLETALNRLPQVTPSFSSGSNNPGVNGAAFVNLRGLGISRNLVLLDGRRAIGANASNSVDLNTVPPDLIDHVEIITGGASAVYGADAVAGVVNVILKDRFDGLEVSGRILESERGDGREQTVSVTGGRSLGGLNLMANVGWARRDEIGKGCAQLLVPGRRAEQLPSLRQLCGRPEPAVAGRGRRGVRPLRRGARAGHPARRRPRVQLQRRRNALRDRLSR